jgi:hypothetical protein
MTPGARRMARIVGKSLVMIVTGLMGWENAMESVVAQY